MKATKIFMMAALALTFAACSNNDDNDFAQQPIEQPANGEITITATLEANDGASTRALSIDGSNIASTWETTDQFAILYNNGTEDTKSIATVDKIDGTTVTITFTIPASLASNTACQIVYPASAAKADNSGADVATALATQDGTIGDCPEVRVGTAIIDKDNHSLSNVTKLEAQNAIFKFTIQDLSEADKDASKFIVSDDEGNVMTIVTPGSATGELYVALPVMTAGTYWFNATIGEKPYIAKATTAADTEVGKYYQTTVKMATIGDVILSNGTFAVKGTDTEQAVLANIGYLPLYFDRFIAIALTDVGKIVWSNVATNVDNYAATHAITIGGTTYNTNAIGDNCYDKTRGTSYVTTTAPTALVKGWRVPSDTDWRYVFYGISSISSTSGARTRTSLPISKPVEYIGGSTTPPEPSAYRTAINTACNNGELQGEYYWSSSEYQLNNELQDVYGFSDNNSYKGFNSYAKSYMYGARVRTVFAY